MAREGTRPNWKLMALESSYDKTVARTFGFSPLIHPAFFGPERADNNKHNEIYKTLAATSATKEEEEIAKLGRLPDGTKPVRVPKRLWRPQVKSDYIEPRADLDDPANHDWLFKDLGQTVIKKKDPVPPRTDIIQWNKAEYSTKFNNNIQWRECPTEW